MEQIIPVSNKLLALGTLGLQAASLVLLGALAHFFFVQKKRAPGEVARPSRIMALAGKSAYPIIFFLALLTAIGTLFYSEVVGYPACKLCWYQRIALYPMILIFGLAWKYKDESAVRYGIGLSLLGIPFALYHYLLQLGITPSINCLAGSGVSCSQRFIFEFGYISFPMMALTVFIFILILLSVKYAVRK